MSNATAESNTGHGVRHTDLYCVQSHCRQSDSERRDQIHYTNRNFDPTFQIVLRFMKFAKIKLDMKFAKI